MEEKNIVKTKCQGLNNLKKNLEERAVEVAAFAGATATFALSPHYISTALRYTLKKKKDDLEKLNIVATMCGLSAINMLGYGIASSLLYESPREANNGLSSLLLIPLATNIISGAYEIVKKIRKY